MLWRKFAPDNESKKFLFTELENKFAAEDYISF